MIIRNVTSQLKTYSQNKTTAPKETLRNVSKSATYKLSEYPKPIFFEGKKHHPDYKMRLKYLEEEEGITGEKAKLIADFDDNTYENALTFLNAGLDEETVIATNELDEKGMKNALYLIKKQVLDDNLIAIANLDDEKFKQAKKFLNEDFTAECIPDLVSFNEEQIKNVHKYIKDDVPPEIAIKLAPLKNEEAGFALSLINENYSAETATKIAKYPIKEREKYVENLKKGIGEEFLFEISDLPEETKDRVKELTEMNADDDIIADCAVLDEKDYQYILKNTKMGTFPEHAYDMAVIKKKNKDLSIYDKHEEKGYGINSAFTLITMPPAEREAVDEIMKKYPWAEQYLKDNYAVEIVFLQEEEEKAEIIFSKQYMAPGKNKVLLTVIMDSNGKTHSSRVEEYPNHSTSSIIKGKNNPVRLSYQKGGDIKEMVQFISDDKTGEVKEVYFSHTSPLLAGCFETKRFDINDFKSDSDSLVGDFDTNIEKYVKSEGETLSSITQNADGSISFNENISWNGFKTEREYSEKRDGNKECLYRTYEYTIRDKNGTPVMKTERTFERMPDGSIINSINGNEYKLTFDDENKIVNIESKGQKKSLYFNEKLAKCTKENLWETVKTLDVDTLLTIHKNIRKWYRCEESESFADGYEKKLATGKNISIITHETGHLKSFEKNSKILDDEELKEVYNKEMQSFKNNFSYNEQEFIDYFSPRADLCESDGLGEFIAETNMILTTYGVDVNSLTTRSQLLIRYFPETIAMIAKKTGKTSTKNLICKE